jgi:hypothetical protein
MVAEVDEQKAAMVPGTVDPAGQPDAVADIGPAELPACMAPVLMHGRFLRVRPAFVESRLL